jgi:hypothetical protein
MGETMKKNTKLLAFASAIVISVLVIPVGVFAADDSDTTVVNAVIGSTISVSASGPINLAITPVSGGSQTSASDTVSVSTNDAGGYFLTLENQDSDTELENGANTIAAHSGTFGTPTALANNTWGYAIVGGAFDGSYSVISNAPSSSTKWAGVPENGNPDTLKTTATTASGDTTTVWYSAKADTTKPNGTYTDTVVYTATTNP